MYNGQELQNTIHGHSLVCFLFGICFLSCLCIYVCIFHFATCFLPFFFRHFFGSVMFVICLHLEV